MDHHALKPAAGVCRAVPFAETVSVFIVYIVFIAFLLHRSLWKEI